MSDRTGPSASAVVAASRGLLGRVRARQLTRTELPASLAALSAASLDASEL